MADAIEPSRCFVRRVWEQGRVKMRETPDRGQKSSTVRRRIVGRSTQVLGSSGPAPCTVVRSSEPRAPVGPSGIQFVFGVQAGGAIRCPTGRSTHRDQSASSSVRAQDPPECSGRRCRPRTMRSWGVRHGPRGGLAFHRAVGLPLSWPVSPACSSPEQPLWPRGHSARGWHQPGAISGRRVEGVKSIFARRAARTASRGSPAAAGPRPGPGRPFAAEPASPAPARGPQYGRRVAPARRPSCRMVASPSRATVAELCEVQRTPGGRGNSVGRCARSLGPSEGRAKQAAASRASVAAQSSTSPGRAGLSSPVSSSTGDVEPECPRPGRRNTLIQAQPGWFHRGAGLLSAEPCRTSGFALDLNRHGSKSQSRHSGACASCTSRASRSATVGQPSPSLARAADPRNGWDGEIRGCRRRARPKSQPLRSE